MKDFRQEMRNFFLPVTLGMVAVGLIVDGLARAPEAVGTALLSAPIIWAVIELLNTVNPEDQ